MLRNVCERSEQRLRKKVFCSQKLIAFWAFFHELQTKKWLFQATFLHLLNKSLHKSRGFKKSFSILQFTKKASKNNFLEQNTFFRKRCSVHSKTFLSFKMYSKLVGTPGKRDFVSGFMHMSFHCRGMSREMSSNIRAYLRWGWDYVFQPM